MTKKKVRRFTVVVPKDVSEGTLRAWLIAGRQRGVEISEVVKKRPEPEVKTFIDFAYDTHLEVTGEKLPIVGGRDGQAAKRMLRTYGLERLQEMWLEYLRDDDPFLARQGRSIGYFNSALPRYVTGGKSEAGRVRVTCARCNGEKVWQGVTCPRCAGTGKV